MIRLLAFEFDPFQLWSYSVMVSTRDSDSLIPGSNPGKTILFFYGGLRFNPSELSPLVGLVASRKRLYAFCTHQQ